MTADQKATAAPLEPACENLPRASDAHEDITWALRVQRINDRQLLVSLDSTDEALKESAKDGPCVDVFEGFSHKREMAKLTQAWMQDKVITLTARWISLMVRFMKILQRYF